MTINRAVTTLLVFHMVTTVAVTLYGDERTHVVGEPAPNGNTVNGNTANDNTVNGNTANDNTSNDNTSNDNTANGNTANAPLADSAVESHEASASNQPHPLTRAMKIAHDGYQRMNDEVRDYTCVLVKRERIDGKMRVPERILAKVRHEQVEDGEVVSPFSVYMKFEAPDSMRGREILFVSGRNDDKFLVRKGSGRLAFLTVSLKPTSMLAMSGNRYPITEFGIKRLAERMIELGNHDLGYQECEVVIHNDIDMSDRICTSIEVMHPVRRQHFEYHLARIYIDNESQVPIRFESYDWPESEFDAPVLKEEYTYREMKLNVGLTDADFERTNPAYGFR